MIIRTSFLDSCEIPAGTEDCERLINPLDLARAADRPGYVRYWLAEHHSIPSVASTSPEIMIGHVASVTNRMRIGSGAIILPNNAPLRIAEDFPVLKALFLARSNLGPARPPDPTQPPPLPLSLSKHRL